MFPSSFVRIAAALFLAGLLTACDSAEERARKHYENGLELLDAGDVQRALVELRNVFVLDPGNIDARLVYARAARSIGNLPESYSHFLRVVESRPDNLEARLALSEMAIEAQNWDEAKRHAEALIASGEDIEGLETVKLALEFHKAATDEDAARMRALTRSAADLFESRPGDPILHRLLIEGYAREGNNDDALAILDIALRQQPRNRGLYMVRARLLDLKGDQDAVEQHLRETAERFPDDDDTKILLIRHLASRGRLDSAEAFLREQLSKADPAESAHVTLITFLRQARGNDAALAELETAISTYEDNRLFRALRAGIVFDQGDPEGGVSAMRDAIEGAEPGEETDRFKVTLARMLVSTGNVPEARQLVDEVLENDPGQVDALKMSARWNIEADKPEEALRALRSALDRNPEDAEAMMLMSEAHLRSGNPELGQDLMALAVETSGYAPDESLEFASSLFIQNRFRPAEDVLVRALRRSPDNIDLLVLLGQVHIATEDWARAEQVEATLRRIETEQAEARAEELQFQIFGRREGRDRAIAYLENLIASDNGNSAAKIALIRAKLEEGQGDEAVMVAEDLVEEFPDNPRAKLVLGNTLIALKDFERAEDVIRDTMQESDDPAAALQLVRVLGAQARVDEARVALEDALETTPEDMNLLWVKASFLEQANDIEGAIGIYESLYARDSRSLVIANNLASLLATYREDDESLQRAIAVAQRLRETDVPPFQDTYGWILYRRGQFQEAIKYLEPAAEALSDDPVVQFHLGKAYQALGRTADARASFRRAIDAAPENDPRPQIAQARDFLAENGSDGGSQ